MSYSLNIIIEWFGPIRELLRNKRIHISGNSSWHPCPDEISRLCHHLYKGKSLCSSLFNYLGHVQHLRHVRPVASQFSPKASQNRKTRKTPLWTTSTLSGCTTLATRNSPLARRRQWKSRRQVIFHLLWKTRKYHQAKTSTEDELSRQILFKMVQNDQECILIVSKKYLVLPSICN